MNYLKLKDGDTVAILGGGPAGSFFVMHISELARKLGISLNLIIIERKSFVAHGPTGCNMCAGVLGGNIVQMISALDLNLLKLDSRVIRQNVEGFKLNIQGRDALIMRPSSSVYTVFRGVGPRSEASSEGFIGFDSFLLEEAKKRGAAVINGTVTDIVIPQNPVVEQCTVRYQDEKNMTRELKAALIVGAFGVNSSLSKKFKFGYIEPGYWHTCQTELMAGGDSDITAYINIFSRRHSKFLFTAVTPKGKYLTVSGIGVHVKFSELVDELKALHLDSIMNTNLTSVCHCHPRLPVTAAVRPFYTRVVMVGDACVSRYMKNGIESAFITSKGAAETVLLKGIDEAAFRDSYYPECVLKFVRDNRFGRAMFFMHSVIASRGRLGNAVIAAINNEGSRPIERQWMSNITWHMFIGDKPYRAILRSVLNVMEVIKLLLMVIGIKRVRNAK
jgi:flavin-dependent dehydrogenase